MTIMRRLMWFLAPLAALLGLFVALAFVISDPGPRRTVGRVYRLSNGGERPLICAIADDFWAMKGYLADRDFQATTRFFDDGRGFAVPSGTTALITGKNGRFYAVEIADGERRGQKGVAPPEWLHPL